MAAQPVDPLRVVEALDDPEALELVGRLVESEMTLLESRLVQLRELSRNLARAGRPEEAFSTGGGRR